MRGYLIFKDGCKHEGDAKHFLQWAYYSGPWRREEDEFFSEEKPCVLRFQGVSKPSLKRIERLLGPAKYTKANDIVSLLERMAPLNRFPPLIISKGPKQAKLSIQASTVHYCEPRENLDRLSQYSYVECEVQGDLDILGCDIESYEAVPLNVVIQALATCGCEVRVA